VCWSKLSFIAPPYCERLGIPFAYDPGPGVLSMEAIADPPAYRHARAAVRFDDVARTLVHALKYGDRLDLAPMMGSWMATAGRSLTAEADAIIPVPLHWRRYWARRFNQSALLAEAIAKASRVPLILGAQAREATPSRSAFSRRALNVKAPSGCPAAAAVADRRRSGRRRDHHRRNRRCCARALRALARRVQRAGLCPGVAAARPPI
jgi:predicted amidophosphoribosyltransferase